MNYTGYISIVETSISNWDHFGFKITQTSVFLDFLNTVSAGNWSLKVHKNQCFINDQLLCGKCQPIYTVLRPQDELHYVDFFGLNKHPTLLLF